VGLFNSIKKLFGGTSKPSSPVRRPLPPVQPEPEPDVPEVKATDLIEELAAGADLVILDCREEWERRQAHILNDLHISMNEIPGRLSELEVVTDGKQKAVVVYCASGMRSYGVAHFLNEQGFQARNLDGGITRWQIAKGPVA
jgi:rhodanese-related sulfurtransferase